ncbi:MAG: hypothetical protein IPG03_00005 [Candidatus Microthrix sp.]|nr:hypothetical protein [Candidatus Microthrix sp.]MBK6500796.1 hypothetical protein [Candidatus Microthrix sp.]
MEALPTTARGVNTNAPRGEEVLPALAHFLFCNPLEAQLQGVLDSQGLAGCHVGIWSKDGEPASELPAAVEAVCPA